MTNRRLTDGSPVPEDDSHTTIDSRTGQQRGYVVLSDEERMKGFVKPVRTSYLHVGPPATPSNLRDLRDDEHDQYDQYGYVKFEPYADSRSITGKYWTQRELDRAGKQCGCETRMGYAIAETYARDPNFYSGTFCVGCQKHFPLNEFIWEPDGEPMDPTLQDAWAAKRDAWAAKRHERDAARKAELIELKNKRVTQLYKEIGDLNLEIMRLRE
jgi:hypothetical protein